MRPVAPLSVTVVLARLPSASYAFRVTRMALPDDSVTSTTLFSSSKTTARVDGLDSDRMRFPRGSYEYHDPPALRTACGPPPQAPCCWQAAASWPYAYAPWLPLRVMFPV